jgi:hypothetical protein
MNITIFVELEEKEVQLRYVDMPEGESNFIKYFTQMYHILADYVSGSFDSNRIIVRTGKDRILKG